MKNKRIGIWLDRDKAILIQDPTFKSKDSMKVIPSGVEQKIRSTSGSSSGEPYSFISVFAPDRNKHRRENALSHFYREILNELRGTKEVLLMGSGKAKTELQKKILESKNKEFPEQISLVSMKACTIPELASYLREKWGIPNEELDSKRKSEAIQELKIILGA